MLSKHGRHLILKGSDYCRYLLWCLQPHTAIPFTTPPPVKNVLLRQAVDRALLAMIGTTQSRPIVFFFKKKHSLSLT